MPQIGGYPGKTLIITDEGVVFSECYGSMMNESGGFLCTLERMLDDPSMHEWVRAEFGDWDLERTLEAVRTVLSERAR